MTKYRTQLAKAALLTHAGAHLYRQGTTDAEMDREMASAMQ